MSNKKKTADHLLDMKPDLMAGVIQRLQQEFGEDWRKVSSEQRRDIVSDEAQRFVKTNFGDQALMTVLRRALQGVIKSQKEGNDSNIAESFANKLHIDGAAIACDLAMSKAKENIVRILSSANETELLSALTALTDETTSVADIKAAERNYNERLGAIRRRWLRNRDESETYKAAQMGVLLSAIAPGQLLDDAPAQMILSAHKMLYCAYMLGRGMQALESNALHGGLVGDRLSQIEGLRTKNPHAVKKEERSKVVDLNVRLATEHPKRWPRYQAIADELNNNGYDISRDRVAYIIEGRRAKKKEGHSKVVEIRGAKR